MSFEPKQIEMVCLEDLVSSTHIYRKFLNLWNLDSVRIELERLEVDSDYKGYGIYRIFLCLLQFLLRIYLIVSWKDLLPRVMPPDGFANLC